MIGVIVKVVDRGVAPGLNRLADRMNDFRATFRSGRQAVARALAPNWGRGWKQLAASTVARKGHSRPLEDSGRLRRRWLANPVLRIRKKGMSLGSRVPYARMVSLGSQHVPRRAFVYWSRTAEDVATQVADTHIIKSLRDYNGR